MKQILPIVFGFSGGLIAAGGVAAVFASLGLLNRLAGKTGTGNGIGIYGGMISAGTIFGNIITIYRPECHFGKLFLSAYGLCAGIFIGCVAVSLAELLNINVVVFRRLKIERGYLLLLLSIAIGKFVGSMMYYYLRF